MARAQYLSDVADLSEAPSGSETPRFMGAAAGGGHGDNYMVQAKLAALRKQFRDAEQLYLQHVRIAMQCLHCC